MKRLGCLLAVLLPDELVAWLLAQMSGISVSNDTLWQWVQAHGAQAWQTLQSQLEQASQGQWPTPAPLSDEVAALPLLMSADGVTIPFRPNLAIPHGKVCWREVKVAILARVGHQLTQSGKWIT